MKKKMKKMIHEYHELVNGWVIMRHKKKRRLTINPGSHNADEGKTCDELSDIKYHLMYIHSMHMHYARSSIHYASRNHWYIVYWLNYLSGLWRMYVCSASSKLSVEQRSRLAAEQASIQQSSGKLLGSRHRCSSTEAPVQQRNRG